MVATALCGLGQSIGVVATSDVGALLELDLDCIVYSPLHFDAAEVSRLLRAGVNVVTTAEMMTGTNLGADARDIFDRPHSSVASRSPGAA